MSQIHTAGPAATGNLYPVADFLRVVALTLMSWAWSRLDATGDARMANGSIAFARWVWPELAMRHSMVSGALVVAAS